jgi:tetratricopeptide (TPR) repeat protein
MKPDKFIRALLVAGLLLALGGCAGRQAASHSAGGRRDRPTNAVWRPNPAAEAEADRVARAHAQFARGILAQDGGTSDQALEWFTQSLASDPSNTALALDVARAYFVRRDLEKAIAVLRPFAAASNAPVQISAFHGFLLTQAGRKDEALGVLQRLAGAHPEDATYYRSAAALGDSPARKEAVIRLIDAGAARPAADAGFLVGLAEAYAVLSGTNSPTAELKRRQEAVLVKAAAQHPTDPAVLLRLGERYEAVGDTARAEAVFAQLRRQAPDNPRAAAGLAEVYLREGKLDLAKTELEGLAKNNPGNPLPRYYLALVAMQKHDFTNALSLLRLVRTLKSDFEPAHADLAAVQLDLRQVDEALLTLDQAREQFGPSFRREYLAGVGSTLLKKFDAAIAHFMTAETIARTNEPAALDHKFYFQIGATLEQAGRAEEAEKYMSRALSIDPNYDEALNHLGYTWVEKGINLPRARDMIERAVKQQPDNPAFLDSLGWVLFKVGKPADALPYLQKASKLMPMPDATVEMHVGDVLKALGREAEAKAAWERSKAVEDTPEIRERLK